MRSERVHVEEPVAGERDAGRDRVVERPLDEVGVARVAGQEEEPLVQHHERDRRAGLLVGVEGRQVVVVGEPLVAPGGAKAAGDEHPPLDGVLPDALGRGLERRVLRLGRDVERAGEEVQRAHRVAGDDLVVADLHVVEPVGAVVLGRRRVVLLRVEVLAPVLDEVPREAEVARVARRARQLHERELQLRVAGVPGPVAGAVAERALDEVGGLPRDVEEVAAAGRLEVRDARLDEVAGAVELVVVAQVREALLVAELVRRVEVAVGPLRAGEEADGGVRLRGDARVLARAEAVRRGLERLVHVGVGEDVALVAARLPGGRALEVLDRPHLAQLAEEVRHRRLAVRPLPRGPERVGEDDPAVVARAQGRIERRCVERRRGGGGALGRPGAGRRAPGTARRGAKRRRWPGNRGVASVGSWGLLSPFGGIRRSHDPAILIRGAPRFTSPLTRLTEPDYVLTVWLIKSNG